MILANVKIGKKAVVRNAILDKNVVVPDGVEIGVDHDADRRAASPSPTTASPSSARASPSPRADSAASLYPVSVAVPRKLPGYMRDSTYAGIRQPRGARRLGGSALDGDQESVADGQQRDDEVFVLLDRGQGRADGFGVLVAVGGIGGAVVPAATLSTASTPPCRSSRRPCSTYSAYSTLSASMKTRSYAPSLSLRQHVQGGAGDQPEALGRDADGEERLAGRLLVFGLDVDAGQDPVRLHAGEQRQPGDAGAGADLDDRFGPNGLGQKGQRARRSAAERASRPTPRRAARASTTAARTPRRSPRRRPRTPAWVRTWGRSCLQARSRRSA